MYGVDHDMEILKACRDKYRMLPGEWGLGDLAYGGAQRYLCGRKNEGGDWDFFDEFWNALIGFYRARVEKVIARLKNHEWCQRVFRGSYETLVAHSELTVVMTALEIRREFEANKPMFEVLGPWQHTFPH